MMRIAMIATAASLADVEIARRGGKPEEERRDRSLDERVEEPGSKARADPGQGNLDLDPFGRRDRNGVLILHGA